MILTYAAISLFIIIVGLCIIIPYFSAKKKLLNYINNDEHFKTFIFFLVVKDLYKPYIRNIKQKSRYEDLLYIAENVNPIHYIALPFIWAETKEKYDYWREYNMLWVMKYKDININDNSLRDIIKIIGL